MCSHFLFTLITVSIMKKRKTMVSNKKNIFYDYITVQKKERKKEREMTK